MKSMWVGAVLALCAVPVAGQTAAQAGGVSLAPRAGWVVPIGGLGEVSTATAGTLASTGNRSVTLGSGATFGTAALFDVPGLPVQWRVDIDHAPSLDVRLGGDAARFDAAATYATAGVVTRPRSGTVQPFAQAGLGFRALRFRTDLADPVEIPDGRVDLLGRFGGGLAVHVGPVALTAELTALTSTFLFDRVEADPERSFHVDMAGLLGLRLRVF